MTEISFPGVALVGVLDSEGSPAIVQNVCYRFEQVCAAPLLEVPASFEAGLRDCLEGRVVDMERALSQPPPSV